ncbi:MAG: corrinoid protein [Candidatus Promineifilaceae bacterium]|jgi:5-methyltetrahydrofolate--homocysteine methyltransferase
MKNAVYNAVLRGDAQMATEELRAVLEDGADPEEILNEALIAAMIEVGRLYEEQEYFVPEMMISARAMQRCLRVLEPYLGQRKSKPSGRFLIGTVQGDLHDIGKNLVAIMLEGVGFQVLDLGTDVSPQEFVKAAVEFQPDILGMSALLTTTMPMLQETIIAILEVGMEKKPRIMVGGAPVTQEYAERIGADLYAPEAASAARKARKILQ